MLFLLSDVNISCGHADSQCIDLALGKFKIQSEGMRSSFHDWKLCVQNSNGIITGQLEQYLPRMLDVTYKCNGWLDSSSLVMSVQVPGQCTVADLKRSVLTASGITDNLALVYIEECQIVFAQFNAYAGSSRQRSQF